jgi:DMSO reductase family type II enzyme chaperone
MDRSVARGLLYNTLSLCYLYPDETVYPWILEGKWVEEMKKALHFLTEGAFENYVSPIEEILKGKGEDLALEIRREYTRLFINGFPRVVAPPYGSVYLEKNGLVFGRTTSEVLQFYHDTGFTLKEELKDLPDHIAHELEFMGILANQESQAKGSERIKLEERQMDFFSRFILPWVPSFCERIEEHSRIPFYRHIGNLTREFINLEKNYLGIPEELNSKKEILSEQRGG